MKRVAIKVQMTVFGRCYCAAAQHGNAAPMFDLEDLDEVSLAVPSRRWASRTANRRSRKTGHAYTVVKWARG